MTEIDFEDSNLGVVASQDESVLSSIFQLLAGSSRKTRQLAASVVNQVSVSNPACLLDHLDEIVAATDHSEAQTRWECLDALSHLVELDAESCESAIPSAETILFDDEHGIARLSAFRFLCVLGSTSEARSLSVWPLIDEALQCFHGNVEYLDMLGCLSQFAGGSLHADVKKQIISRLKFDSENNKSSLGRRSKSIIASL